jgi:hypothetical protein
MPLHYRAVLLTRRRFELNQVASSDLYYCEVRNAMILFTLDDVARAQSTLDAHPYPQLQYYEPPQKVTMIDAASVVLDDL